MPTPTSPRFTEITEPAIARLIDAFYASVRADPQLGPIFDAAIEPPAWPGHLATMRRFWSSVMLASGRYSGDPVGVHRAVHGLERGLFPRWLALFEATAADLFIPALAARFTEKARRIADSLKIAVFHRPGASPEGLTPPPRKPPPMPETGPAPRPGE